MSVFEQVAASVAVNKQSAMVARAKGVHFEHAANKDQMATLRSDCPLPIKPCPSGTEDLTGLRFGRFSVIGLALKSGGQPAWVVRCSCGYYETRKRKVLMAGSPVATMCSHCRLLERMKRGELLSPSEQAERIAESRKRRGLTP